MFDTGMRLAADADVVAEITSAARAEATAAARRLAAVAELVRRRCGGDDRALWACDSWDAAAAEVAAAMGISHGRACTEMYLASALSGRLPRVAALFADGTLSYRVVASIANRTHLVTDPEPLAAIDKELARLATSWGPLSSYKLDQAIDVVVDRHDPGALRRTRASARSRNVEIGGRNDEAGTSSLWGRLYATDAQILDRRLTAMAGAVCEHDPRTLPQRRADALGALAAGAEVLACQCGTPQCPTAADAGAAAKGVIIHVVAQTDSAATVSAPAQDPHISGDDPCYEPFVSGTDLNAYLERRAAPEPDPACAPGHGVILGGPTVPGPLLADLIRRGATVRPVHRPPDAPEPGYRPSTALAEFVRMRDLTCRFPNCDVPAQFCDIDHAVAWPHGPTHPSNLRCQCRKHHLLKTFWTGSRGWRDTQSPDGTIRWVSPTGTVYTTAPGSRLLFPTWDTTTATLTIPVPQAPDDRTGVADLVMPRRGRTRIAERARRVKRERALNNQRVADRNAPPPF